jgi:dsDNA-specific endonuclease/ATPase MutS2
VQNALIWHDRLGRSADEIASDYGLSLADVYAALAYYHDHREEIARTMREDEEFVAELRKRTPSQLRSRLGG